MAAHGDSPIPHFLLAKKAVDFLSTFHVAMVIHQPTPSFEQPNCKWKPPREGMFKVNFDGVVFFDLDCAGVGVVVSDHKGKFLSDLSKKIVRPLNPEVVEVKAAC